MTFIIDYYVEFNSGASLYGKQIRVKNKDNELMAKCALEDYLKRKHPDFKQLVITNCQEDFMSTFLNFFSR